MSDSLLEKYPEVEEMRTVEKRMAASKIFPFHIAWRLMLSIALTFQTIYYFDFGYPMMHQVDNGDPEVFEVEISKYQKGLHYPVTRFLGHGICSSSVLRTPFSVLEGLIAVNSAHSTLECRIAMLVKRCSNYLHLMKFAVWGTFDDLLEA